MSVVVIDGCNMDLLWELTLAIFGHRNRARSRGSFRPHASPWRAGAQVSENG